MTGILAKLRELDVAWYGAAAGAAAAGAALVPSSRIAAGLVAGGLVLALGVWRKGSGPCCAECAGQGVIAPATVATSVPVQFDQLFSGAGPVGQGGACS